jgi:hypothetical protein
MRGKYKREQYPVFTSPSVSVSVYGGIKTGSRSGRMDYPKGRKERKGKEGMQVGEYGVKKYGDKKIVCRKTRNYHEV